MLSRLHVINYALIDDLEIDFASGLNIITGETGAGKSILVGALGLGSHKSRWLGPPCRYIRITLFALPQPAPPPFLALAAI